MYIHKTEKLSVHIAIAGNIGVGKTTLCKMLAKHYKWSPLYEAVDTNPYLDNFYDDMQRWSFNLQVFFLNSRFRQVKDILKEIGGPDKITIKKFVRFKIGEGV